MTLYIYITFHIGQLYLQRYVAGDALLVETVLVAAVVFLSPQSVDLCQWLCA